MSTYKVKCLECGENKVVVITQKRPNVWIKKIKKCQNCGSLANGYAMANGKNKDRFFNSKTVGV